METVLQGLQDRIDTIEQDYNMVVQAIKESNERSEENPDTFRLEQLVRDSLINLKAGLIRQGSDIQDLMNELEEMSLSHS